jgi:tyrosine-protein kinase Etk/Wzc
VELREYLNLIWRRKVVILVALTSVVVAVGAYVYSVKPLFKADCKLLLVEDKSVGTVGSSVGPDLMLQTLGNADPISTQMEIIKTRPILSRVVEILGMVDENGKPVRTETLKGQLAVEAVRNTTLISIAYRDRDPARAAAVVNTLARVFIEQNQRLNQEEITSTKDFLQTQIAAQKETLAEAEKKVLDFKKSHDLFSQEKEAETLVDAQVQLEATRMRVETELKGALAQQANLIRQTTADGAVGDRFYSYWMTALEEIKGQITGLLAQQGSTNSQIAELKGRIAKLPPQEAELARLLGNEGIADQIYTTLLSKYEEVRVSEAAKIASVRLIEPAVVTDTPVYPNKKQYLLLAAVVGLLLGFSLALLLEHFDDSLRSLDELKAILPYEILGYVPYQESESMLYLSTAPQSPISEAFRLVHANLKFKPMARRKSFSMMVTSATPGEGKSTLAANLALAFATNGTRAAIVNLDLRRPVFNLIFGRTMERGITDFLIGESRLEEILVREDGQSVTIVPSGTVPPNPSELVASKKLRELMQYLAEHFDVVIYDTPPVTLVAETLELARYVDGIMLVVDTSKVTRSALRTMNELVSNKDLVIVGTVLNRVNRIGSLYRHYGGYYDGKKYRGV